MGLFSLTQELAIDLGTANTLIIHNGRVVVDEPSIVAIDSHSGKLVAIGERARAMHEKTNPNIKPIRPLKDGVIADFTATELMLRGMIKKVKSSGHLFSPSIKMVICIPSGSTNVEIRAVRDSAEHAGGREVYMIYEPMAAALGAGLAGLAGAGATGGPNMLTALPQSVTLNYNEIAYALEKSLIKLDAALMKVLETMPPELYADIVKNGIYLAGGGALIKGLDRRLTEKTGLPFHIAEDPLRAIARGTGIALKNIDRFSFLMK